MQKTQYVYLLLYIRKFLRQSRAYLSIFEYKPVLWNIILGEKNIVRNCVYIMVVFYIGVMLTPWYCLRNFFHGTRAGLTNLTHKFLFYNKFIAGPSGRAV